VRNSLALATSYPLTTSGLESVSQVVVATFDYHLTNIILLGQAKIRCSG